ncbi:MAG TPA: rRNA maturation RNase YbeY [bacterium]|nr:rRNA maturation RNase YbeY [bacterium]
MLNVIDIAISGDQTSALELEIPLIEQFVGKVLALREIPDWELSILFCSDKKIQYLNRKYRNKDCPTDVLSFSQLEQRFKSVDNGSTRSDARPAGDIVVSVDTLIGNAKSTGVPVEEELKRLLVHGILHLEGMDHEENTSEMITLQEDILKRLEEERVF